MLFAACFENNAQCICVLSGEEKVYQFMIAFGDTKLNYTRTGYPIRLTIKKKLDCFVKIQILLLDFGSFKFANIFTAN